MKKTTLTSVRTLSLNSDCKIEYIYSANEQKIIPVLMLTGIKSLNNDPGRVYSDIADGHIGVVQSGYDSSNQTTYVDITGIDETQLPISINPYKNKYNTGDWLIISLDDLNDNIYKLVYPRIFINSLGLKTDANSLILKYKNNIASNVSLIFSVMLPYKDYSILSKALTSQYVLTLNNNTIFKNNLLVYPFNNTVNVNFFEQLLYINYILSNADVSIYLDALLVAKLNALPKVSYNITANYLDNKFINNSYKMLGHLVRINDQDLKFNNIKGYISEYTLDLDNPLQDSYNIKNYKTKFEDLFSTITAQTEAMKKNAQVFDFANNAFTSSGNLTQLILQSSIQKVDLNYAFDNGKLTIDEKNGIWGTSDNGVVAFRGGGIFTATEKNADGNWKWNTGITPEGINADLITTGQLDTNLIKIYAGDHLRFQMNGDGIFAYKSSITDAENKTIHPLYEQLIKELLIKQKNHTITVEEEIRLAYLQSKTLLANESLDDKQYVVFNDNGLSLVAKKGAKVLNNDKTSYTTVLDDDYINEAGQYREGLISLDQITRVEVSWEGLILRNWDNERVFYADPDTGNLTLKGKIEANSGHIGTWEFDEHKLWSNSRISEDGEIYYAYVALNSGGEKKIINARLIDTSPYAFWAGSEYPALAPFYIRKDGGIRARFGLIGGWSITGSTMQSNKITFYSADSNPFEVPDYSYGTTGYRNLTPVIWIHGTTTLSNQVVTTNNPQYSICNINTDGNIMAQDFYLISNDLRTGEIISIKSIKDMLQRLGANI